MTTALIVSADEQRAWQIREALSAADVEIGQVFATSHALLHRLAQPGEAPVDLLVIDENSTPMNQWDLIRELGVRQPTSAVLAVVTEPQPEDYTAALSNGARGVVRFPLSYEEIASLVESAVGWSAVLRDAVATPAEDTIDRGGKILVTAGAKGGTGTTTLALHLALRAAAHRPNDRIVFVDLDLQKPDASVLLDVPQNRNLTDLLGVIEELTPRHLDDVLFRHPGGLRVLFGPEHGEDGERVTEFAARQMLSMLAARADLVVVDVGSVIGEAGATALEMAHTILSVSTLDVLSLRGVHRQTELWDRLNIHTEGSVRIVLNKVTKNSDLSPSAAKRILNYPLLEAVAHDDTRGLEAAVNRRDTDLASPVWKQDLDAILQELSIIAPPSIHDKPQRPRFGRGGKKNKGSDSPEALPPGGQNSSPAPAAQADQGQLPPRPEQPPAVGTQPTGVLQPVGAPAPAASADNAEATLKRPRSRSRFRRAGKAGKSGSERGAVSIEALGIATLFGICAAIAFQMLLVGVTFVLASHAADEGARAAAVGNSATAAAVGATPGAWADDMTVSQAGGRVTVKMKAPTLIPKTSDFALIIPASAGVVKEPS